MVTKKSRRRQLAHAAAERNAVRRVQRNQRRRTVTRILTGVLVVVLLAGLVWWIATHKGDASTTPTTAPSPGHYAVTPAALNLR